MMIDERDLAICFLIRDPVCLSLALNGLSRRLHLWEDRTGLLSLCRINSTLLQRHTAHTDRHRMESQRQKSVCLSLSLFPSSPAEEASAGGIDRLLASSS